jgi:hypothetical protein
MKIGVNIKIDVTKLDKARFFKGKKGTYANIITFIDIDNKGEHGDNGFVTQEKNKDEEIQMPILGNATVFWQGESQPRQQQAPQQQYKQAEDNFDDDSSIPF